MTSKVLWKFKAKRSKVKVTAWHSACKYSPNCQLFSWGLLDFAQISYRLWSHDAWCTTNFQGQHVQDQDQGHSMT